MIRTACVILTLRTVFATTGNYLHLTADTVTTAFGEPVNDWADSSETGKHFEGQNSCGKPILAQASWNSDIEVVHFGHNQKQTCLKSKSHEIPMSGTFVAVISWTGYGGEYGPIAAAGGPSTLYWGIRRASKNKAIHLIVKGSGSQTGKIPINLRTPYVIIGRLDNNRKKSSLWVWDINANEWKGKAQSTRIKGIHNGNQKIFLGRAPNKPWEWLDAELALFAIWDYVLSDDAVDLLIEQYKVDYGLPTPTPVTKGNYVHLSANTVATSIGESVRTWADSSGSNKDFVSRGSCGKPILAKASWDSGTKVVHFGHSQKQTCMVSKSS